MARAGGKLLGLGVASMLAVMVGGAVVIGACLGLAIIVHTTISPHVSIPGLTFLFLLVSSFLLLAIARGRRLDQRADRFSRRRRGGRSGELNRSVVEDTAAYLADLQAERTPPPGG